MLQAQNETTADLNRIFRLDWENHPGLKRHIGASRPKEIPSDLMADLDELYLKPKSFPEHEMKAMVSSKIQVLSDSFASTGASEKMRRAFHDTIPRFCQLLEGEYAQSLKREEASLSVVDNVDVKSVTALQKQGIYITKAPEEAIQTLSRLAEKYSTELATERQRNLYSVAPISIPKYDPIYNEVTGLLRRLGIQQMTSAYLGHPVEPLYVALQHSLQSETWWRGCYEESNDAEYMHLDFDYDLIKCIIYLSDVTKATGPFKYVEGSNHLRYSRGWLAFYKCFEKALEKEYAIKNPEDFYYRRRYRNPDFYKDLQMLPEAFAGASHFGDDLVLGSEAWTYLKERERTILSSVGNCFVFDGSQLIHRGGMVVEGERFAIQVGFRKKPPLSLTEVYRDTKARVRAIVKGKR